MQTLLVTGGAGFIGANFVHQTVRTYPDLRVSVLDALTYAGSLDNLRNVGDRVTFVRGSVLDTDLVDHLVAACDTVVHFAAESHVDNALTDPLPFIETNILGTYRLLEAVRRHDRRLHHVSTDEVFGQLPVGDGRFTEDMAFDPSNPYSASKASSDLLVRAWVRSYGVRATISNCGNNYGPFQHIEKFIPRQVTNVLTGRRMQLYGTGENVREWTHVDDHNRAIHLILERGRIGETYLIGSGTEYSNRDVVRMILDILEFDEDVVDLIADRPAHDLRYAIDSGKIRAALGWQPDVVSLEDGLAATIDWYRANGWWWQQRKDAVEARYATGPNGRVSGRSIHR